jgi:hypothetical protein
MTLHQTLRALLIPLTLNRRTPADAALTEAADTASAAGLVGITGTMTATEAADTASASELVVRYASPKLFSAVLAQWQAGVRPGRGGTKQWERFCDNVREDAKVKADDDGCSDKSIKRMVAEIAEINKSTTSQQSI